MHFRQLSLARKWSEIGLFSLVEDKKKNREAQDWNWDKESGVTPPGVTPYLDVQRRSRPVLIYSVTEYREVLGELHHEDDEGPAHEHTGGPEEGVEERPPGVEPRQDHAVLPLVRVVVAGHLLLRLQLVSCVSSLCASRATLPDALTLTYTCRQGYLEARQQSEPQL
ncbi:hypothetical protein JZ751_013753 [Albula glossodonta]|uniref:Uncharacterized protein n=1 Tax=Albula glossodonta TaxID=121402 RepID=A0A8T2NRN9_9TELE|nr:hypothetical protein JZ751_013753 [Albula glossodonta]